MSQAERQRVTDTLRKLGTVHQPYPDAPVSTEDIEDAKYFTDLARKNENGTLSINEAETVREMFDEDGGIIIDHDGKRWVEADT